jgi:uncharacterized protein (TIGR00369 family)
MESRSIMELNNPFLERLGITLADWREGHVELRLLLADAHGNRTGIAQGGVIATLLDAACGYAGLFSPQYERQEDATTITLSINYIAPAKLFEPVFAVGWVTGQGRSIYYATAEVLDEKRNRIATAQGAFKRSAK